MQHHTLVAVDGLALDRMIEAHVRQNGQRQGDRQRDEPALGIGPLPAVIDDERQLRARAGVGGMRGRLRRRRRSGRERRYCGRRRMRRDRRTRRPRRRPGGGCRRDDGRRRRCRRRGRRFGRHGSRRRVGRLHRTCASESDEGERNGQNEPRRDGRTGASTARLSFAGHEGGVRAVASASLFSGAAAGRRSLHRVRSTQKPRFSTRRSTSTRCSQKSPERMPPARPPQPRRRTARRRAAVHVTVARKAKAKRAAQQSKAQCRRPVSSMSSHRRMWNGRRSTTTVSSWSPAALAREDADRIARTQLVRRLASDDGSSTMDACARLACRQNRCRQRRRHELHGAGERLSNCELPPVRPAMGGVHAKLRRIAARVRLRRALMDREGAVRIRR